MKNTLHSFLAVVAISVVSTASALAQSTYTPPSFLLDGNSNVITAGVTPWIFDVDSSGKLIGGDVKQIAHGDTVIIAPRILDPQGQPRAWPTNMNFVLMYQSGSGMTQSNLWWKNCNPVAFPVYRTIQQTSGTGPVYTVSNVNVVDTGRVAFAWTWSNDFSLSSYTCIMAAYGNSTFLGATISQPAKWQMNMMGAPALNGAIATNPVDWMTFLSNTIYSITSQSVSNIATYALRVSTNGAAPGYYFLQTPTP